jgi:SAM-dependent methyltransferase
VTKRAESLRRRLAEGAAAELRQRTGRWALARRLRRKLRDWVARSGPPRWEATRDDLAFRYLRGDGIEIGAFNAPLRVPASARVRYVDHASADQLRELYADELDMHGRPLVVPDVVDEGERLGTFADESLDFVVANHMLEHVEDPISALHHFLRVLRPGGVLFLTLPDPRHNFDRDRPRTSVEHLLRDHRDGPEASRREHHEEWARFIEGVPEDRLAQRADEFAAEGARHHFHVWELDGFLALLSAIQPPADIEAAQATEKEFAVILRKNPAKGPR